MMSQDIQSPQQVMSMEMAMMMSLLAQNIMMMEGQAQVKFILFLVRQAVGQGLLISALLMPLL